MSCRAAFTQCATTASGVRRRPPRVYRSSTISPPCRRARAGRRRPPWSLRQSRRCHAARAVGRDTATARAACVVRRMRWRELICHDAPPLVSNGHPISRIAPPDVRTRRAQLSAKHGIRPSLPHVDADALYQIGPPHVPGPRIRRHANHGKTTARAANSIAHLPQFSSTEVWRRLRDAKPLIC